MNAPSYLPDKELVYDGVTCRYLAVPATEVEDGREDWSVVMLIVHSASSSVSASSMVADMSDWSPEQLLRLKAATAAIDVDRSSSPEAMKRLPANTMPRQLPARVQFTIIV